VFNSNPRNNTKVFNAPAIFDDSVVMKSGASIVGSLSVSSELSVGGKVFIDQNSNVAALQIDSEATNQPLIEALTPVITSGVGFNFSGFNSLDSGSIAVYQSNSSDSSVRNLIRGENTSASATGVTVLKIIQNSTGLAADLGGDVDISGALTVTGATILGILANLNVTSSSTTDNVVDIAVSALSLGRGIRVVSTSTTNTAASAVAEFRNDNSATGFRSPLKLTQESNGAIIDYRGLSGANTTSAISTLTTFGSIQKFVKVLVDGNTLWMAAYADPS